MFRIITLALGIILIIPQVPASVTAATYVKTNIISPVTLTGKSYMGLKEAQILSTDKGNVFTFTVSVFNRDQKELQLIDYWTKVKTKTGNTYTARLISTDKSKTKIAPQSSENLTFYANVGTSVKLSDLIIDVIKWDFSTPNYERLKGSYKFSANYSSVTPIKKNKVVLLNNTKLSTSVDSMSVTKDGNYYAVDIAYSIENIGYRNVTLPEYEISLKTNTGVIYPIQTDELKDLSVQPRDKQQVHLKASIPIKNSLKQMQMLITLLEQTDKINLPIATYWVPDAMSNMLTELNQKRKVTLTNTTLLTQASKVFVNQTDQQQNVTVYFNIENSGLKATVLPAYEFIIQTNSGLQYPLTSNATENLTLNPKSSKQLQLSGSIAKSVNLNNAVLLLKSPKSDKNINYLIAGYKLPKSSLNEVGLGNELVYESKERKYSFAMKSIQRLPSGNDDTIAAEIRLTNKDAKSLSLPLLSGYFVIDGVKIDESKTKIYKMDQVLELGTNNNASLIVYAKIPYTTNGTKYKLVLFEKENEQATTGNLIGQFTSNGITDYTVVKKGESLIVDTIGKRASYKVQGSKVYDGKTTDLFYVNIVVENLEKRSSAINKLGGYLKLENNEMLPITLSNYKTQISPYGKVLISAWATIPKGLKGNPKLILGTGIAGIEGTENLDTIVNATAYETSVINDETINSTLNNISVEPYNLSMYKIYSTFSVSNMTVDGLKLDFVYDLEKKKEYEGIAENHQLMIEIVDQGFSKATFSKKITLGKVDDGNNQTYLEEGKELTKSIVITDPEIINKVQNTDRYQINIYDVFQDNKTLVASKILGWYTLN